MMSDSEPDVVEEDVNFEGSKSDKQDKDAGYHVHEADEDEHGDVDGFPGLLPEEHETEE